MATGPQRFGSSGQGPQPFGLFGGGTPFAPSPLVSRYFNFFDGVQEVVEIGARAIPSPTLGFGVEFSLYGSIPSDGTIVAQNISDNSSFREFQIFTQQSTGGINVVIGGVVIQTNYSPQPGDYQVNYDGTRLEIIVNGTEVYSQNVTAGGNTEPSATFTIGGRHDGANNNYGFYYEGVIANVRITDNGTLIHNWAIDDNSNVIADSVGSNNGTLVNPSGGWGLFDKQSDGDWLGSVNLWSGPLSFSGVGWTDNNDGSYTCDGSQTANTEIRINDRVSQGLEYRCVVNVESIQSGSVQCRAGNAASPFSNTTGIFSADLIPTTADPHLRIIGDASFSGTVDGVSYKQLLRVA